jgi:pyruvate, orthophosphate dikinase
MERELRPMRFHRDGRGDKKGTGAAMNGQQFVYAFDAGDGKNKMLLGGKGANLCEMTQMGLNVPPGFVITTEACLAYQAANEMPAGLMDEVREQLGWVEEATGKRLGDPAAPLLVSVRSGAAMSMPGMMDTILNLGLNDRTLDGLIALTNDARFAYDAYRRFVQLFGKIALDVPDEAFSDKMSEVKRTHGVVQDVELSVEALKELTEAFLAIVAEKTGRPFPSDPLEQLATAIQAVFRSWMGKRAVDYRRQFKVTPEMANGTAVSVCAMVFGNMGNDSATGVGFTRNPGTGENALFGEYLMNAQGEDVVAGIRTPKPIAEMAIEMPQAYSELLELRQKLEQHYHEVQDFEFTIERGRLYMLQTRNGKMNARASVRTSVEMVAEGLITKERALLRLDPGMIEQLLVPQLAPNLTATPLATGLAASPGAASGAIVFDADSAEARGRNGEEIVLVREETRPEDIHGFFAAQAILTSRGGKTSHAAVVARGMGKPCVSGCEAITIDVRERMARVGGTVLREGDIITVDGSTGRVYSGRLRTVEAEFFPEFVELLSWADAAARLEVMANADTPADAARAREYGAMGIGLCRTERMFNAGGRLPIVQEMILAGTPDGRANALARLLPIQRADFVEIFTAMAGLPVTVRLLDPPLHEFLPHSQEVQREIASLKALKDTMETLDDLPAALKQVDAELATRIREAIAEVQGEVAELERNHPLDTLIARKQSDLQRILALTEVNPMLGHRGVRLGLSFPEIYQMQIRAILEAAAECSAAGIDVHPEIMVPQVVSAEELKQVHAWVSEVREEIEQRIGRRVPHEFGTMVETVRACMRAARLAAEADFFSFGTNDLTQATFSFSREDAENKFLPFYTDTGLLRDNPFEVLDVEGVGRLIELTVKAGREAHPDLRIGICGEHGGHPDSIRFCHYAGLDYVSCSAPRVPVARLAAAQAKLREAEYRPYSPAEQF